MVDTATSKCKRNRALRARVDRVDREKA